MKKFLKEKSKGFTLIESLVSIAIILIAVIGPLSLILKSLNSIIENKNRIIASYLAEELVEDLRSFRDGLDLACGNIQVNYDSSGDIVSGTCNKNGANVYINDSTYLKGESGEANFLNRDVSWKLFLDKLPDTSGENSLYLDKTSFDYTNLDDISTNSNCYLVLGDSGYVYKPDSSDLFCRIAKLTKVGDNALKVEVSVRYVQSTIFGLSDKYVKVVDYIYER